MKITATFLFASAVLLAPVASAQQITVYSAGPENLAEPLAKGFEKQTGIKVNLFQGTTGNVLARYESERNNPHADVVILASWPAAAALKTKGDLVGYVSPNAKTVPAFLKDDYFVAQGVGALTLVWNSKSGKPRPSDWADLIKPEYRDAMTMPDPAQSGSAYDLVAGLAKNRGDAAWNWLASLKKNGLIAPGANAQALNPVLQGAKAVTVGAVDYLALAARQKGESIEVIYPSSGTILAPRPMMIPKSSKNQDAARRFVDYALSNDGQQMVAQVFLMPARADIKLDRPGINSIKALEAETDESPELRKRILDRFRSTMGK